MTAATPQQYHATFEFNPDARAVLDDLIERFLGAYLAQHQVQQAPVVTPSPVPDPGALPCCWPGGRSVQTSDRRERVGPQAVTAARGN